MPWSERLSLSLRQTFDRGRGLSVFLSKLSMMGLVLAVAILIAVLSVMNGFERELHARILGLLPHVTVRGFTDTQGWQDMRQRLGDDSAVVEASLFRERDVLAIRGARVHPARLLGLEPAALQRWRAVTSWQGPVPGPGAVLLGSALATKLGVATGDPLRLVLPSSKGSIGAAMPVPVAVRVAGLVHSGTELDEGLILGEFVSVGNMGRDGEGEVSGLALRFDDVFAAPEMRWRLSKALPTNHYVTDWTATHGNLYAAIRLSRDLVTFLLLSVIAVAAFNVISSLVLVVIDRRRTIAMLRTLGATPADIGWIFLFQGGVIGVTGASLGLMLGWVLALSAPGLASGLEWLLGIRLLNTDVYPLSFLPVDIRFQDAVTVWCVAVALCLAAAVFPARRASRLSVATVLAHQSA